MLNVIWCLVFGFWCFEIRLLFYLTQPFGRITPTTQMRILIATVTAGGGHLAAAAALEEAWKALRPRDVVERVDILKFFSPLQRKIHSQGYVKLVEHAPE